jgi:uncharacterized DUF497 family protein
MPDQPDNRFERIRAFEWDEQKRETNLKVHGIDFYDVMEIFDDYSFVRRSDRNEEIRYQIFGYVQGREVALACAIRGEICRLISARRANRGERQKYYSGLQRHAPERED